MSTPHDAHHKGARDAEAQHDAAHAHDDFDPEPAQTLPADEPKTPAAIPALGIVLFAGAAIAALVAYADPTPTKGAAPSANAAATAAPTALPALPTQPRVPGLATIARPNGKPQLNPNPDGKQALKDLTPDQLRDLREKVMEFKRKRGLDDAGTAAPGAAPAPPKAP